MSTAASIRQLCYQGPVHSWDWWLVAILLPCSVQRRWALGCLWGLCVDDCSVKRELNLILDRHLPNMQGNTPEAIATRHCSIPATEGVLIAFTQFVQAYALWRRFCPLKCRICSRYLGISRTTELLDKDLVALPNTSSLPPRSVLWVTDTVTMNSALGFNKPYSNCY